MYIITVVKLTEIDREITVTRYLHINILAGHGNALLLLGFCNYANSIVFAGRKST